jgi:hypothetical protein
MPHVRSGVGIIDGGGDILAGHGNRVSISLSRIQQPVNEQQSYPYNLYHLYNLYYL